jgi:hypothetical protein
MGREYVTMKITGRLSRHNDPRDRDDDRSWEELAAQVHRLVAQPRYRQINAEVEGGPDVMPDPDPDLGAGSDGAADGYTMDVTLRVRADRDQLIGAFGELVVNDPKALRRSIEQQIAFAAIQGFAMRLPIVSLVGVVDGNDPGTVRHPTRRPDWED